MSTKTPEHKAPETKMKNAERLNAERIRSVRFATSFRGLDPDEVRAHLEMVALAYDALLVSETMLRDELARRSAAAREVPPDSPAPDVHTPPPHMLDVEELRAKARAEADAVLASARNEANAIVARSNDEAARIILRARAESRGRPTGESLAVVEATLSETSDPVLAREQARLMIGEARAVRERVLGDLAKRRRVAHVQLEQMRVARERLVESLREARKLVDEATRDLSTAEIEAKIAAEAAGRRVNAETMPTPQDLEIELLGSRHLTMVSESSLAALADVESEVSEPEVSEPELSEPLTEVQMLSEVPPVTEVPAATTSDAQNDEQPEGRAEVGEGVEVGAPPVVVENGTVLALSGLEVSHSDVSEPEVSVPSEQADDGHRRPNVDIDGLFAKLRAEREAATAEARKTLAGDDSAGSEDAATELTSTRVEPRTRTRPTRSRFAEQVPVEGADVIDLVDGPFVDDSLDPSSVSSLGVSDGSDGGDRHHEFVIGPLQAQLTRVLKRHLQDEQSAALAAVRTARKRTDLESLLGTEADHHARWVVVVTPVVADAARAGADRSGFDLVAPEVLVSDLVTGVVVAIVSSLRNDVNAEVSRFAAPETDGSQLVDLVSGCYRSWTTDRLGTTTTGVLLRAYELGTADSG